MKKIVMIGAGQMGRAAAALLNESNIHLMAFGDNRATGTVQGVPIRTIVDAVGLKPDAMVLTVRGTDRQEALEKQIRGAGFTGDVIPLERLTSWLDIRKGTLLRLVQRLADVTGAIAELGVYKGEFAALLNNLFPDRKLYLFDTFAGFDGKDIATEQKCSYSAASTADFSDTSAAAVLARMPHRDQVILRPGFFPETTAGLEEKFALVSLDADLYTPTLAGLEWFLPRMTPGGMVILHDWDSPQYKGVKKALEVYEKQHGKVALVPLGDLHGTGVIVIDGDHWPLQSPKGEYSSCHS